MFNIIHIHLKHDSNQVKNAYPSAVYSKTILVSVGTSSQNCPGVINLYNIITKIANKTEVRIYSRTSFGLDYARTSLGFAFPAICVRE